MNRITADAPGSSPLRLTPAAPETLNNSVESAVAPIFKEPNETWAAAISSTFNGVEPPSLTGTNVSLKNSGKNYISDLKIAFKEFDRAKKNHEYPRALASYSAALCILKQEERRSPNHDLRREFLFAICHLKGAALMLEINPANPQFLKDVSIFLDGVYKKTCLLNKERQRDLSYLLGSAYLFLFQMTKNPPHLEYATHTLIKAAAPIPDSSSDKELRKRQKAFFSLGFCYLQLLKTDLGGSTPVSKVNEHLEGAQRWLDEADEIKGDDNILHFSVLMHLLLAIFIDNYPGHMVHLKKAAEAPAPFLEQRLLLGFSEYLLAFDGIQEKPENRRRKNPLDPRRIDLPLAMTAFKDLEQDLQRADVDDFSLFLCLSDCARQLAWLTCRFSYTNEADNYTYEAYVREPANLIAVLNPVIYHIQSWLILKEFGRIDTALPVLMQIQENADLDSIPKLRKCIDLIKEKLSSLKKTTDPDQYFALSSQIGDSFNTVNMMPIAKCIIKEAIAALPFKQSLEIDQNF